MIFFTQSYQIQIILKRSLTQRWDPNRYYLSESHWVNLEVIAMKVCTALARSSKRGPQHQTQFCVILRTPLAQLIWDVNYIDYIFAERWPPPMSILYITFKWSDGEAPVMLELWRMQSTPLLPPLSGPLWLGVIEPDMSQIEIFHIKTECKQMTSAKLSCLK